jgi:hypothetical protein
VILRGQEASADVIDVGRQVMEAQAQIGQVDVNRGLRDRLGRNRASGASVRQDAELMLAVNDLQDLARNRFGAQADGAR